LCAGAAGHRADVTEYLRNRWRDLTGGLWFVPALVVAALTGGALAVGELDERVDWDGGVLFGGSAEAARVVLSTIAGSVVTIVALTFSITIVVLQLAATQYTPRILRQFLRDRTTQLTAGYYVGVFVYCLLVLRTVRGSGVGGAEFVPALSITVAILLAVGALALLIVFIDNIARLIQVANVVPRITRDAAHAAREAARRGTGGAWRPVGAPAALRAQRPGYVRRITPADAAAHLPTGPWWIEAVAGPGSFVTTVDVIAHVWPAERAEEARTAVEASFAIANERDVADDPALGLRQLADIAIRALSPGVNDPTTAVMCIGYLRELAVQLSAGGRERVDQYEDPALTFRIVGPRPEVLFEPLVEVGRYAIGHVRVAAEILAAIGDVARRGEIPALRRASIELGAVAAAQARTASDVEYLEQTIAAL
jgi:uncharacterized membrane protein